jgi:hypothetical protein
MQTLLAGWPGGRRAFGSSIAHGGSQRQHERKQRYREYDAHRFSREP